MLSVKCLLHGCEMQRLLAEFHNFLFIITIYTPQFTIISLVLIMNVFVNFYKRNSLQGFSPYALCQWHVSGQYGYLLHMYHAEIGVFH